MSWSADADIPEWWNDLKSTTPIVYLSLGSSGPRHLIPKFIEIFAKLDANLVLSSAGANFPKYLPKNVFCADYLPAELILKRARVAITNGGSPGSYQALQAGVPVLGIPTNMDQLLCMEYLPDTGACISVRADLASSALLKKNIIKMLSDTEMQTQARKLKDDLSKYSAARNFKDNVIELLCKKTNVANL